VDAWPPPIVLNTNWRFDHADGIEGCAARDAVVMAHPLSAPASGPTVPCFIHERGPYAGGLERAGRVLGGHVELDIVRPCSWRAYAFRDLAAGLRAGLLL